MRNQRRPPAGRSDTSTSEAGFTLIELLVVVAILGILAVVGVLSVGGLTANAKTATNQTELTQVQDAANAYQARYGTVAASTAVLVTDGELRGGASTLKCTYTISQTGPTVGDVSQTSCPA